MNREEVIDALKGFYITVIKRARATGSSILTRELIEHKFEDLLNELEIDVDELS